MLAEQVQRGISVAFLFCGAKGEPISFDDYRSYIANLPQALSSRMPLPDDPTCVRWGYGNPTAGADTPFMVRYAAVTPGSSFIVVVHYEAAALKGGSPSYSLTAGYSPYRVREFQCATLEAMRAVPDIADKSANCDLRKTIDFIFGRLTLALVPYFALALWIVWYTGELSAVDFLQIGAEAIGILIVPGLIATVFVRQRRRIYFYPIAVAGAFVLLLFINKGAILNAYEVRQFKSEMEGTAPSTPSSYLETFSRSETSIGRALSYSLKAQGRRIQELFGEFGDGGLENALAPAALQDATKRRSLASPDNSSRSWKGYRQAPDHAGILLLRQNPAGGSWRWQIVPRQVLAFQPVASARLRLIFRAAR